MAAMIAHELRNPLAGIRGAVQAFGAQLPADARNSAIVKEIVTRIDALNEMMKDLLFFARPPAAAGAADGDRSPDKSQRAC